MHIRKLTGCIVLQAFIIVALLLVGCTQTAATTICDTASPYHLALKGAIPGAYAIENMTAEQTLFALSGNTAVEAFDAQALPLLRHHSNLFWYPQYTATVVLLVDRDQVAQTISGYGDIRNSSANVSISSDGLENQFICAALSYALDGGTFALDQGIQFLAQLKQEQRLKLDDADAPIRILFDYQAAALRKAGANVEIIVPVEGTLTYTRGLLAQQPLSFPADFSQALIEAGLRLPDGSCLERYYPSDAAYARAALVSDFASLNTMRHTVAARLRREVNHSRIYSTADNREHHLMALSAIFLFTLWSGLVAFRAMHRGVRLAAICNGALIAGWVLLRAFKYQTFEISILTRYCWYGFYLFQLCLPLVFLYLACVIGKPEQDIRPPRWWYWFLFAAVFFNALVFTNDLHQWVFVFDLNGNWSRDYSYGFGYVLVWLDTVVPMVLGLILLLKKCKSSPRRKGILFPIGVFVLLVAYGLAYVLRFQLVWEGDFVITVGFFTMLFYEVALHTGLIPINTRYRLLFTTASLNNVQILDAACNPVLLSAKARPINDSLRALICRPDFRSPYALTQDRLLFVNPIPGGAALYEKDMSTLHALQEELRETSRRLRRANASLAREKAIRGEREARKARAGLIQELDDLIRKKLEQIRLLLPQLNEASLAKSAAARINLLAGYIKRRCNLMFLGKQAKDMEWEELIFYLEEAGEFAQFAELNCFIRCAASGRVPLARATALYDFFFAFLEWALDSGCSTIIAQLACRDELLFTLIPSTFAFPFAAGNELNASIFSLGGAITSKILEDTTSVSLWFGREGGRHD